MTFFSSAGALRYLRQDWFTVLLVTLVLLVSQWALNWAEALEYRLYDAVSSRMASPPSKQVAIIAIDDQSLEKLGAWPWPREMHARLIDQLAGVKAKAIVPLVLSTAPEPDSGLQFIRRIKALLGSAADGSAPRANQEQLHQVIAEAETALDGGARLAESFKKSGNVIMPWSLSVSQMQSLPDRDGVFRRETLLVSQNGQPVRPSLALLAAAAGMDAPLADIALHSKGWLQLGKRRLPLDSDSQLLVPMSASRNGQSLIAENSFADVISGEIPAQDFADKVVIIGLTAPGVGAGLTVPGGASLSQPQVIAQVVSDLIQGQFIAHPEWGKWLSLGGLLLIFAYLAAALPLLSKVEAAFVSLLILVALMGAEIFLLSKAGLWIELVFPAALLMAGHFTLAARYSRLRPAAQRKEQESEKTRRMMALALQGQGQLDMAFERLRRVPIDPVIMADLYALAADFERKKQHAKAQAVYTHMATFDENFRDIKEKINPEPNAPRSPSRLRQLGRYRIERELGKGAMGVVYLGRDPTIGRVVAIKTMALSQEFEGDELTEVRDRFFREAEAAGRLQHPHIVTIFDAGEDHDLAYIAMEFLRGEDLGELCKSGQLLPVSTVLSIAARVADALGYAHAQNIVHRDIKPANIMFDPPSDTLKVADFGIARITDSSKTKTGLVLGTPSFMSPEQLAGKKVDGRTDLYSLGVLLFQMLTGVLPFHGSTLAELMQKIAGQDAPDLRVIRPELPAEVADLVKVALRKNPNDRYQRGEDMAREIRAVLSGLVGEFSGTGKNQLTMHDQADLPEFEKTATLAAVLDLMPRKK